MLSFLRIVRSSLIKVDHGVVNVIARESTLLHVSKNVVAPKSWDFR